MNIIVLALILHFVADFVLQSREMALNKSAKKMVLLQHVGIHFVCFFIGLLFFGLWEAFVISGINAVLHAIIDWNVWRGYKAVVPRRVEKGSPLWKNDEWQFWNDHWFFLTIGADQLLHTLSILFAIWIATK